MLLIKVILVLANYFAAGVWILHLVLLFSGLPEPDGSGRRWDALLFAVVAWPAVICAGIAWAWVRFAEVLRRPPVSPSSPSPLGYTWHA